MVEQRSNYDLTIHEVRFLESEMQEYNKTVFEYARVHRVSDYANQIVRQYVHKKMMDEERERIALQQRSPEKPKGLDRILSLFK